MGRDLLGRVALAAYALAVVNVATPALRRLPFSVAERGASPARVVVPINKSQVIRSAGLTPRP
jgi:hypothetical protein